MSSGIRFDPTPLLRGHWKGLLDARFQRYQPDWWARGLLVVVPLGLAGLTLLLDWSIKTPTSLLSAVALLAGALVGAFGSISTMRLKLTEWVAAQDDDEHLQRERDMIDETVAHMLTAALLSAVLAVLLVIGDSTSGASGVVTGALAALIIGLGTYVALLFALVVPLLYAAYLTINQVRDRLSGFARGRF